MNHTMRFTNVYTPQITGIWKKNNVLNQALICAALGRLRRHYGNVLASSVIFNVSIVRRFYGTAFKCIFPLFSQIWP